MMRKRYIFLILLACLFIPRSFLGLILLTSDGRLPNSVLRGKYKQPKVYKVRVDKPISRHDIDHLRVSFFYLHSSLLCVILIPVTCLSYKYSIPKMAKLLFPANSRFRLYENEMLQQQQRRTGPRWVQRIT